jgi:putative oxidoreductase
MKFLVPLGRLLFSLVFILSSFGHFSAEEIQYAASKGVPLPSLLVPLSGIIALLGGLSILLGYKARYGAWAIILFLVPVTLMMHNFWTINDPFEAKMQLIHFTKNLAILGGALLIAYFGGGPFSLDNRDLNSGIPDKH